MKTDFKPDTFDLMEAVAKLQLELAPVILPEMEEEEDEEEERDNIADTDSDSDFDALEDIENDAVYFTDLRFFDEQEDLEDLEHNEEQQESESSEESSGVTE